MEKTQWTPESKAAFLRGEKLLLVVCSFDFIGSMLGSWPLTSDRRGQAGKGEEKFLDSGWALFVPDGQKIDWDGAAGRLGKQMEAHADARLWRRHNSRHARGASRSRLREELSPNFMSGIGGSQEREAQALSFAHVVGAREKRLPGGAWRGQRELKERKKKGSAILDRNKTLSGKRPHRGDRDAEAHAFNKLGRAARGRRAESMENAALREAQKFLATFEGVSCAQRVSPPDMRSRSQWRRDFSMETKTHEGAENGLAAYREFLLAQLRAEEIADFVRPAIHQESERATKMVRRI